MPNRKIKDLLKLPLIKSLIFSFKILRNKDMKKILFTRNKNRNSGGQVRVVPWVWGDQDEGEIGRHDGEYHHQDTAEQAAMGAIADTDPGGVGPHG